MASVTAQQVHAGHTIKIKIGGQTVGRIQSIDGRRSFGQEGVYEIGSIMPKEHVALRYEGTIAVDKFMIRKSTLQKLGLAKYGIGILQQDVIDVEVTDTYTGDIITVYRGCSLQDYSETHRVNAISGENASFVYLSADDGTVEADTAIR